MKDYTELLERLAIERRARSFGSPSDQEIAVEQLADMAENYLAGMVEEIAELRAAATTGEDRKRALECLLESADLIQGSGYPELAGNIRWAARLAATTGEVAGPQWADVLESDAPTTELLGQLMRGIWQRRGFVFKGDDYELVDSENSRAVSARYEALDMYGDIVRYLRKTAQGLPTAPVTPILP